MPLPLLSEVDLQYLTYGLTAAVLLLAAASLMLVGRVNRLARPRPLSGRMEVPAVREVGLGRIEAQLERLGQDVNRLRSDAESALRRVGVVRYDAFRDMGGHMSVSVALLDNRRNGLVISILNGRDGSRGYAKSIRSGVSPSPLSEEEQEALAQALDLAPAP